MSSIRCVDLLRHAQENSYAVGYFEAWNLESLLAVVRAAEIAGSPVMVGFCGEYLANPQRKFKEDINLYGALARQVAQSVSVPVATLLNESIDMNVAYQGVKADFDMVMFVDEGMPIDRLTVVTRKLVEFARAPDTRPLSPDEMARIDELYARHFGIEDEEPRKFKGTMEPETAAA